MSRDAAYHALSLDETARVLGVDPEAGLDDEEAKKRLAEVGENRLPEEPPEGLLRLFFRQLTGVLIVVLMLAAVLAAFVGEARDAIGITLVVLLNAVVGTVQERRAARSLASLRAMLAPTVRVRRGGALREIPAAELVPGDVVLSEAGDRFPADGRLVEAADLEVDESTLTGESLSVTKDTTPSSEDVPLGDRSGAAFSHTTLTRGRAVMMVTETGPRTEAGQVAHAVAHDTEPPTPLQKELDRLGKKLALIVGVLCLVLLGTMILQGRSVPDALVVAVALAAAAIPEGLPAVVTLTLAIGVRRMARARAIVRRLTSVEGLGSVTVICTDKTGTLTENRMVPGAFVLPDGRTQAPDEVEAAAGEGPAAELLPLLEVVALCNDASPDEEGGGDPTERALYDAARLAGLDPAPLRRERPRRGEVPFDASRRLMATLHDGELLVKGAPSAVIPRCARALIGGEAVPLDDERRAALEAQADEMSGRGLRMLVAARRSAPDADPKSLEAGLEELTFVGMVGLVDPPRQEAAQAVKQARAAGIRLLVVTGDHAGTAGHVAHAVGIEGEAIEAAALRGLEEDALAERLASVGVIARVNPDDKARMVSALQRAGEVVAMTGDGVNDAVALARADVGVAMGLGGADVAREASDIVLTDDDLGTIVAAIREGRAIYDNILRFLLFQLSTAAGAVLVAFGAPLLGAAAAAFTATQLLFVNLIMDGPPALALGASPPRGDELTRAPRAPGESMLTGRRLLSVVATGGLMAAATLGVMLGFAGGEAGAARTAAFTTFVVLQCANALIWRGNVGVIDALTGNKALAGALVAVLGLQALVVYLPGAQELLSTTSVGPAPWGLAIGAAFALLGLDALRRLFTSAGEPDDGRDERDPEPHQGKGEAHGDR